MELEYMCAPDFWLGFILFKKLVCSTRYAFIQCGTQTDFYYYTKSYGPVKMIPVNK